MSEKRYYYDAHGNIYDAHDDVCLPYSVILDRLNALEAERDRLRDALETVHDQLKEQGYVNHYGAVAVRAALTKGGGDE